MKHLIEACICWGFFGGLGGLGLWDQWDRWMDRRAERESELVVARYEEHHVDELDWDWP
jgi:hypothetical protein